MPIKQFPYILKVGDLTSHTHVSYNHNVAYSVTITISFEIGSLNEQ